MKDLVNEFHMGIIFITHKLKEVLEIADEERRLKVRANADTPHDARVARAAGRRGD